MSDSFWISLLTAFGLILVIEGLLYALFPAAMQRMMERLREAPPETLRKAGLTAAVAGVGLVWLIRG
jgi:uncharacterized protein YjeT (DUF2065 family)